MALVLRRVSPLFDVAGKFTLVHTGNPDKTDFLDTLDLSGMFLVNALKESGIDIVICSAISRRYARALVKSGIELVPGVIGSVDEIVNAYLSDSLSIDRYAMPGCGWQRQFRGGHCPNYREIFPEDDYNEKKNGGNRMKIVITAQENNPDAEVDPRFGRAKCFMVYDKETGEFSDIDNTQNFEAAQGAGIQAAKAVIDTGAGTLISGHVGPKAFAALNAAGIDMFTGAKGTVREALESFEKGELDKADNATVGGHW